MALVTTETGGSLCLGSGSVRAYAIGMGVDLSRHRPGTRNDYAAGARERFARRCRRRLDEAKLLSARAALKALTPTTM